MSRDSARGDVDIALLLEPPEVGAFGEGAPALDGLTAPEEDRETISGPVERINSAISLVVSFLARGSRGTIGPIFPFAETRPLMDTKPSVETDPVRDLGSWLISA